MKLSRVGILFLMMMLAACGFELRGIADLSFKNLYIQGPTLSISKGLKKALKINGVNIVEDPAKAELFMETISDSTEKRILSLNGTVGTVREFELFYRVSFRLRDPASETWGKVQTIEERRDFSYTDSELLAKSYEELFLYDEMRTEALREIMRRLVVQKPSKRVTETTE